MFLLDLSIMFTMEIFFMIKWHRRLLKQIMDQFNLDSYHIGWISFLEGVFFTILFYEYFLI